MKVILRMFIEEPFKVDSLCKQVDIVVTLSQDVRRKSNNCQPVKQKRKKHFTKLAGATRPQAGVADVGGAGWAPGELGLQHLQAATSNQPTILQWQLLPGQSSGGHRAENTVTHWADTARSVISHTTQHSLHTSSPSSGDGQR